MKYGLMGRFIKTAFGKTAFGYIERELPGLDLTSYRRSVLAEYRAIVARTPSVGPMSKNMFVMRVQLPPHEQEAYRRDGLRQEPRCEVGDLANQSISAGKQSPNWFAGPQNTRCAIRETSL